LTDPHPHFDKMLPTKGCSNLIRSPGPLLEDLLITWLQSPCWYRFCLCMGRLSNGSVRLASFVWTVTPGVYRLAVLVWHHRSLYCHPYWFLTHIGWLRELPHFFSALMQQFTGRLFLIGQHQDALSDVLNAANHHIHTDYGQWGVGSITSARLTSVCCQQRSNLRPCIQSITIHWLTTSNRAAFMIPELMFALLLQPSGESPQPLTCCRNEDPGIAKASSWWVVVGLSQWRSCAASTERGWIYRQKTFLSHPGIYTLCPDRTEPPRTVAWPFQAAVGALMFVPRGQQPSCIYYLYCFLYTQ